MSFMSSFVMRRTFTALLTAASLSFVSTASMAATEVPAEVRAAIQASKPVGQATFSWLFWDLFEGSLWSNGGKFSWDQPFALSLTYRTEFSATELTEQTTSELDRLTSWPDETLAAFAGEVAKCMADVSDGNRFTTTGAFPDRVVLYLNGQQRCSLEKPGLRGQFFRIWLSYNSKFPAKSRQLTGQPE
jgi:hypothetical protein